MSKEKVQAKPERKAEAKVHYGMVIDLRRCIGCHSCSVACKAEVESPLGVYRSWVKIIEKGTYPTCANSSCLPFVTIATTPSV